MKNYQQYFISDPLFIVSNFLTGTYKFPIFEVRIIGRDIALPMLELRLLLNPCVEIVLDAD